MTLCDGHHVSTDEGHDRGKQTVQQFVRLCRRQKIAFHREQFFQSPSVLLGDEHPDLDRRLACVEADRMLDLVIIQVAWFEMAYDVSPVLTELRPGISLQRDIGVPQPDSMQVEGLDHPPSLTPHAELMRTRKQSDLELEDLQL